MFPVVSAVRAGAVMCNGKVLGRWNVVPKFQGVVYYKSKDLEWKLVGQHT